MSEVGANGSGLRPPLGPLLTSYIGAATIKIVNWWTRRVRIVGASLLTVFVATLSATCLAQARMNDAERACCATMASACGASMASDHQCCRTETPRHDPQITASSRVNPGAPASVSVTLVEATIQPVQSTRLISRIASEPSPPSSRRATHVVLSVFRI